MKSVDGAVPWPVETSQSRSRRRRSKHPISPAAAGVAAAVTTEPGRAIDDAAGHCEHETEARDGSAHACPEPRIPLCVQAPSSRCRWFSWTCLTVAILVVLWPLLDTLYNELLDDDPSVGKMWDAVWLLYVSPGYFWAHSLCWTHRSFTTEHVFRPVTKDCSYCEGITDVDRLTSLDPETFATEYAFTGRPVVVVGEGSDWPALHVFSLDFLRWLYFDVIGRRHVDAIMRKCNFFRYRAPSMRTLVELFDKARDNSSFYVGWSNCESSAVKMALRHLCVASRTHPRAHHHSLTTRMHWLSCDPVFTPTQCNILVLARMGKTF